MLSRYDRIINPQLIHLQDHEVKAVVYDQVRVNNYRLPAKKMAMGPDREYSDNGTLWQDIISERVRATANLTLNNFLLFEWFPRSPGLFHTDEGRRAREFAMDLLVSAPKSSSPPNIDDAEWMLPVTSLPAQERLPDYMYIFNPYGKIKMLKGGVGSIRLKPRVIDSGQVWFMTASSTPVAHEGFPIALPNHYFEQFIDQIATNGMMPCTIKGKLQILENSLQDLYQDYTDVPEVYLLVTDVIPEVGPTPQQTSPPRVSVAVSFLSNYENRDDRGQIYASYVTFFPGQKGSLKNRIEWLENSYVKGYEGQIITDFDEYNRRFANAIFSLKKIRDNKLNLENINLLFGGSVIPYAVEQTTKEWGQIEATNSQRREGVRRELFQTLGNRFSIDDLKTLSFSLHIDHENLPWDTKDAFARELIRACENQGLTDELIRNGRQMKPQLDWPTL